MSRALLHPVPFCMVCPLVWGCLGCTAGPHTVLESLGLWPSQGGLLKASEASLPRERSRGCLSGAGPPGWWRHSWQLASPGNSVPVVKTPFLARFSLPQYRSVRVGSAQRRWAGVWVVPQAGLLSPRPPSRLELAVC